MANSWSDRRGGSAIPHFDQRELALALRVVRGFDVRSEACDGNRVRGRSSASALALFLVFLLGLLHTAAVTRFPSYPVGAAASAAFGTGHEDVSMQFKKVAAVVSSALAVSAGSHAQDAVQWRVEDGGNGHWYQWTSWGQFASTHEAFLFAEARGAYLATLTTANEEGFVQANAIAGSCLFTAGSEALIGLLQDKGAGEPSGGWRWVTNETLIYSNWRASEPSNSGSVEDVGFLNRSGGWNDGGTVLGCAHAAILEWSADCNSDGIVDYGQIRAGELVDANANNIPDCCEQGVSCAPCPGDVDESGTVNGVDLAAILAVWGSDGGKYPRADINNDGEVNGADLATVLGSWGSCK
jgi:hypothetical protein